MKKFLKIFFLFLLILAAAFLVLLRFPTPTPKTHSSFADKVDLNHLPPLQINWIPTGSSMVWEPFVKSGGRINKSVKMVYGALLVQHPKGSFLIDGGLGSDAQGELTRATELSRFFNLHLETPLIGQKGKFPALNQAQFIFLTHAHWDHLSGAKDFPGLPIYLLPDEMEFIEKAASRPLPVVFPEHREALKSRFKPIELKNIPYENFTQSLDWFGDGSVVLVPLPGHTPGSLGIFLNVSPTQRYFVVGDAIWTVNAHGEPESRSLPAEWFSDNNSNQARATRAQLAELIKNSNEITLVPVHDEMAVEKFPK